MELKNQIWETWNSLASAYRDKFMTLTLYDDSYQFFCDLLKGEKQAHILEIGCGPGNITRYLQENLPNSKIKAIDFAPSMIQLASQLNPKVEFEVMDCRQVNQIADKFEAIVCGFCMPYLTKEECVKLIVDCAKLLRKEGIFYLSTIEGKYADSGVEKSSDGKNSMMVYQHEEQYLNQALMESGFRVKKRFLIPYSKNEHSLSKHLIVIAQLENNGKESSI